MSSGEKSKLLEAFYNNIDNQTLVAKEFIWSEFVYDLILFRIQPLIYIIVVLIYINSQRSSQKIEKTSKHLYWLKIIIFGFLTIWGLKYLSFISGYFIIPFTIKHPLAIIFIAIQVFLISQFALTSKTGIPETFSLKKGITKKELEAIARKAKNYIEENNTYLNKEITLHYLSKKINTNSSYLSKAINHHYKLSFTDFLNQFRIKKAKEIIESPKIDIYTMEAIAKQSGFKSISTFNRAFLKFEGQTPSQYKNSVNL
ncbi:helix-turn-helix domain-containing protein [Pontimicrobium aquaticum]|nr:helix-turn-helix domain-containing protein [Pontimicrobium aquaticum]